VAISQNIKILEKYIEADGVDNFTEQAIKKLIRHSLQKEQRDLQELTDELKAFEEKYNMQSEEFHERFHHGILGDDEDFFVWDAKFEMNKEIRKRIRILIGERENDNVPKPSIIHE
jgi:hypothetical protein